MMKQKKMLGVNTQLNKLILVYKQGKKDNICHIFCKNETFIYKMKY